jgi:hypothetical protein
MFVRGVSTSETGKRFTKESGQWAVCSEQLQRKLLVCDVNYSLGRGLQLRCELLASDPG